MARVRNGVAAAAMLAASLLIAAAPAAIGADRGREVFRGHVAARGAPAARGPVARGPVVRGPMMRGPVMRGPMVRGGPQMRPGPVARGGVRFGAAPPHFAGPRGEAHFAVAPREESHWGGARDEGHWRGGHDEGHWRDGHDEDRWRGGHDEGHFWHGDDRPRYAVPPHWIGMHPDWDDGHRPGYWVRPWGPSWEPHFWGGGDWDGRFWPHVDLDWDFPWFMAALPLGVATYWWGNVPYYYWQGVYYVWSPDYGEYVVTDPPPVTGGTVEGAAPPPPQASSASSEGALSLYVYPRNGQSRQQTENDRYQCHEWAVGQTGFDPTNPANDTGASSATPSNYKRAVTACLEARGYSVQ